MRATLASQAAAVLRHASAAYLADVDPAPAAAAYRARADADITHLAHVPLRSWAWTDLAPVTDPSIVAAGRRRYGAPVRIVSVTLRYALRYVDPRPAALQQYLTFVDRDGRALVAGDDDLAREGQPSGTGPWRYGPVAAVRGTNSLVLGPPGAPLRAVADAVDAAVSGVTAVWGSDWNRQVAVIVTSSAPEFAALVGSAEQLGSVSAAAVTAGVDPVSHQAYGQRLVLAPGALSALTPTGERIVLRHELTHLATAVVTDQATPRWVVEGFADYVGNLGSGQSVTTAAAELARAVRAGHVPSTLPLDSAFATTGAALAQTYEQAWLACRLIARHAGTAGLVRFYRTVTTALMPVPQALADAVRTATHESLSVFTAEWRRYLRSELR